MYNYFTIAEALGEKPKITLQMIYFFIFNPTGE